MAKVMDVKEIFGKANEMNSPTCEASFQGFIECIPQKYH